MLLRVSWLLDTGCAGLPNFLSCFKFHVDLSVMGVAITATLHIFQPLFYLRVLVITATPVGWSVREVDSAVIETAWFTV